MMVRGRAHAILLYILLRGCVSGSAQTDHGCRFAGSDHGKIRFNPRPMRTARARVNTIFFAVVRAFDAVLSSMINILDRGFGRNVAFANAPFASTRGMMWAMAQTMDDAETIREAGNFSTSVWVQPRRDFRIPTRREASPVSSAVWEIWLIVPTIRRRRIPVLLCKRSFR